MFNTLARVALVLVFVGSGLTLVADPNPLRDLAKKPPAKDSNRVMPIDPFTSCPTPACMAPCRFGVPPEVQCRAADGSVTQTTYFCCCCGGGGGSRSYRSL